MATESDLIDSLEAARKDQATAQERIEDIGEERLNDLQEAYENLTTLFGRYEERATGSGDFAAFVEFQDELANFVEDLPENLPRREVFDDIDDRMQKRRLTERDFDAARGKLGAVEDLIGRLDARREAENTVRRVERQVRERIHEIRQEIDRLETVQSLGEADIDAPVEELQEPVEAYNDSVDAAFENFRRTAPAREVVGFIDTAQGYPLLSVPTPPPELLDFLESADAGAEPIPTLIEYTEFSRSKLGHYVESPATFQRIVGGNRTYLERLDADPLRIGWPPPEAGTLRFRGEELVSLLDRFAPPETIAALEEVLDLARSGDLYERLRQSARAREELSEEERARLADGAIAKDLAQARERLEALQDAL